MEEAVGGAAGFAVFPFIYLVAIRFPLLSTRWRRNLFFHLVALCLISIVHTSVIALLRMALFPILGFGSEGYGYMPARYPMEFSHLFIYYWVAVSLVYFFHEIRFSREREARQARLERDLAEAQLQNLRLQLQPHFLFNTLNAISAAIYENPGVADEMIGRLSELLRQLLKNDHSQLIPLSREMEILRLYTRIMEARLEDRINVTIAIEAAAAPALVPQFLFQPLVENAIRHGMDSNFDVRLVIHAQKESNTLRVTIRDHGPGIDESRPLQTGIGLRNTAERLQVLYGQEFSFEIRNASGGGAVVEIHVPFQVALEAEDYSTASLVAEPGAR